MAAGTIIIRIRKREDFKLFLNCPKCGRDLTEQLKEQLSIPDSCKYLPINDLVIYDENAPKNPFEIKKLYVECCWFGVYYHIYPDIRCAKDEPIIKENSALVHKTKSLIEKEDFKDAD